MFLSYLGANASTAMTLDNSKPRYLEQIFISLGDIEISRFNCTSSGPRTLVLFRMKRFDFCVR